MKWNFKYFNPLPLYRGRLGRTNKLVFLVIFQSTSSIQRKTGFPFCLKDIYHFNPLPLYRGRPDYMVWWSGLIYFNPLPLYRGRLSKLLCTFPYTIFQSTSSIQRKTGILLTFVLLTVFQSTSSIQRKTAGACGRTEGRNISIHFLYTEEDYIPLEDAKKVLIFQSTSSIQRKTFFTVQFPNHPGFQSTSSIQRKTRTCTAVVIPLCIISIHFLYTEEDPSTQRVIKSV